MAKAAQQQSAEVAERKVVRAPIPAELRPFINALADLIVADLLRNPPKTKGEKE